MTLTLAITTYNRFDLLRESFAEVIDDPRIGEVLIMDDCSKASIWNRVAELPKCNPKIRAIRQAENRGMMQNKADAIALAKNEWVIIFDSDNILKPDYLDAIPKELNPDIIYCPDFAWPNFDYRKFSGMEVTQANAAEVVNDDMGNCAMNTCNYLVHRDTYGAVFNNNPRMKGTDTIYMAYLWFKSGRGFRIVTGMSYFHRVHDGSGFMADVSYNMERAKEVKKLIQDL